MTDRRKPRYYVLGEGSFGKAPIYGPYNLRSDADAVAAFLSAQYEVDEKAIMVAWIFTWSVAQSNQVLRDRLHPVTGEVLP